MKRESPSPTVFTSPILLVTAVAIAAVVFVVDTITELEIAVAVLYVAVVLLAVRILQKPGVLLVSAGCIALTVLSAFLSPHDDPSRSAGVVNCLISISAIAATTYLALKNQSAGTALQDARTELAHVNRLTTLGELTASIAHEVNQPIAGVVANADAALRWLASHPPNIEEARQALEGIVEDGKRTGEIVTRVRALVKKMPARKERLHINEIILEVVSLTQSEVQRNGIALRMQLSKDLPAISGDRIQLQQVVLNLILNAVEAISGVSKGPRELLIGTEKADSNGVRVAVRDSGIGLESQSLDRLFGPFYTTKPDGMGMGLSICRSIVEAHGGQVRASRNVGPGATFQFTLPS